MIDKKLIEEAREFSGGWDEAIADTCLCPINITKTARKFGYHASSDVFMGYTLTKNPATREDGGA